ncbi:MAG: PTS sugar transporter subunit IIC, partial [Thermodesulfobacteriota bacterium]|nr:PTS sugar transporter subunit IIC [Thermodesulfobacteriota bacterium]
QVSAVGGLIALDRTAAFQLMISRPLAAAPLIGLLLGQPLVGVGVGALVELIWINRLPLGGHIPPNECLGSILITAGVILAGRSMGEPSQALIVLGVLLVLPLARLASLLEGRLRRINSGLSQKAGRAAAGGQVGLIYPLNLSGLALSFFSSTLFLLFLLPAVVQALIALDPFLTPPVIRALELMFLILPLIGVSSALSTITVRRYLLTYGLFLLATLVFLGI